MMRAEGTRVRIPPVTWAFAAMMRRAVGLWDSAERELERRFGPDPLRAEVAALSKARAEQRASERKTDAEPATEAAPSAAAAVVEAAAIDLDDQDAVQSQMDKLLAQLEHEIRDLPTITTLAVFSLGVLFGRLLR